MNAAVGIEKVVRGPAEKRKKRSDTGVRYSGRDGRLLRLVGEQCAVSVDQLARVIGRSYRTGRWLRDRWKQAGWIESAPLTHNGPSFLWLSPDGIRVAQSPYRSWRPNVVTIGHIEAVTDVRLLLEQQLQLGKWTCERALAQGSPWRDQPRPHLPDGLLERGGEQIAIEVELTLKSRVRLSAVMTQLAEQHDQVWYFTTPPLLPTLARLANDASGRNVAVYPYPAQAGDLLA